MAMLKRNMYEGRCRMCNLRVAPETGWCMPASATGSARAQVYCADHAPKDEEREYRLLTQTELDAELLAELQTPPTAQAPAHLLSQDDLDKAVDKVANKMARYFVDFVPDLVHSELARLSRTLEVTVDRAAPVTFKQAHKALPTVLSAMAAQASPFLVGPAGSGKTTLAQQCAKALGVPFYMAARVTSEFKLTGFVNAQGVTVRTQFREAYEHGGMFLFDEVDASDPDALTAFNAALANGCADFPDGMVARHVDFYAIAAGNTYGRGADRQYVGRNQLDAATLDRFQVFDIDYDEELELLLAGDQAWTKWVQSVRRAIEHEKVRHIVSPRASIQGAKMLAAGMDRLTVENACVWKGLPQDQRARVEQRMAAQGALAPTFNAVVEEA